MAKLRTLLPFIALILVAILLDQLSKYWMLYKLELVIGRTYELTSFFNLVMVWNQGVSFGMFAQGTEAARWSLAAVTFSVSIGLMVWMWKTPDHFLRLALALIIGGALGNIIDRIRYGAVADFLDFHVKGYHWPAFNVADSAIFVGVALLVYDSIIRQKRKDVS